LDYVIKSGWGNTLQQWANNPTTGALPPDIVRQLVDGAHENLIAAQESLKAAVQGIGRDASQGSGFSVTDPLGNVHTFPNQQTLDQFKKAAGIQ
jgi:hypothetical protein